MSFVMPIATPAVETGPEPARTATEELGSPLGQKDEPGIRGVDARVISDRVYDLMKEEIALNRLRGSA